MAAQTHTAKAKHYSRILSKICRIFSVKLLRTSFYKWSKKMTGNNLFTYLTFLEHTVARGLLAASPLRLP